MKRRLA